MTNAADQTQPRDPKALPPCDLVLRGGITSGVIYPGTVARLARSYRFVNVGGASAGAIAAAVTAAAELGSQTGNQRAFDQVEGLAGALSGGAHGTSLRTLFAPAPELRLLDRVLWLLLEPWTWGTRLAAALFVIVAFGGLVAPFAIHFQPFGLSPYLFLGLYVLLLGTLAVVGDRLIRRQIWRGLPAAGFGICPGTQPDLANTREAHATKGALSDWLHATIQEVAGRDVGWADDRSARTKPVTLGDLGAAPVMPIRLVLTTTNLTQQLPHHFPFLERERGELYFREDELRRVLPKDVVAWLVHASEGTLDVDVTPEEPGTYHPLPAPEDLPILLGVRLSLSFPGLIAAVPLWAIDRGLPGSTGTPKRLRRCWFSDGGITSNFPISVFDAPLPTRPTFCVNLTEAAPERAEADYVWLPESNGVGYGGRFPGGRIATLLDFVGAISTTARNAHENELMLMPGYRERIVEVATGPGEGGLNLAMPPEVIQGLSERGAEAAEALVARFHAPASEAISAGWESQRWVRLRSTMDALERFLAELDRTWQAPSAQAAPFGDVRAGWSPGDAVWRPTRYPWCDADTAQAAGTALDAVLEAARTMAAARETLPPPNAAIFDRALEGVGDAPKPRLGLQMRPWRSAPAPRPEARIG